ncbi:hypothetical protein C0989_009351 [Termitomyces sp. Mn162]|nr:hypothetical protein C0989_009351 [Termitomyces sp. Mn162]
MFQTLPAALYSLVVSLLWSRENSTGQPLRFQLRHEHALTKDSRNVFTDISSLLVADSYDIPIIDVKSMRPDSFSAFVDARSRSMRQMQSVPLEWKDEVIPGPDVTRRKTLLQLAKMTYNSYAASGQSDWYDLGSGWNQPIPLGACTGVTSACAIGGYAMETGCHLGKTVRYDTVTKRNWGVSVSTHPIKFIIEKLLNEDWDPENGLEVPVAEAEKDCVDCFSWEYGDFKNATRRRLIGINP